MGNKCNPCIRVKKQSTLTPNQQNNEVEDNTIVLDNRDGYFSPEDIKEIACKFPDYHIWQSKAKESARERKAKNRKIIWNKAEVLGHGSFGQVVLGLNRSSGELMAVKQVHLAGLDTQVIQDRIQALEVELDLLSEFSHKNIVRYIGTTRNSKTFNIFLEYVSGGTIASVVKKYGPFNENIIKKYVKQILEGLEYLHARNIIHRDIKGANVLVDNAGVCKLADFGSAKKIKTLIEADMVNSLKGTVNWMAPEVVMQKGLGRFADIWSVGCMVIEMATGRPPWSGTNQMATMFQIAKSKTPPPLPPNLSTDLQDFLKLCLKVNPKERANVTKLLKHKFLQDADNMVINEERPPIFSFSASKIMAESKKTFMEPSSPGISQKSIQADSPILVRKRDRRSHTVKISRFSIADDLPESAEGTPKKIHAANHIMQPVRVNHQIPLIKEKEEQTLVTTEGDMPKKEDSPKLQTEAEGNVNENLEENRSEEKPQNLLPVSQNDGSAGGEKVLVKNNGYRLPTNDDLMQTEPIPDEPIKSKRKEDEKHSQELNNFFHERSECDGILKPRGKPMPNELSIEFGNLRFLEHEPQSQNKVSKFESESHLEIIQSNVIPTEIVK